jgi:hypothetical protein
MHRAVRDFSSPFVETRDSDEMDVLRVGLEARFVGDLGGAECRFDRSAAGPQCQPGEDYSIGPARQTGFHGTQGCVQPTKRETEIAPSAERMSIVPLGPVLYRDFRNLWNVRKLVER